MGIRLYLNIKQILWVAVVSIIMLELILFLAGQYLLWQRRVHSTSPGAIPIVCVGDSHTFGVGTSMSYSYPAQLEQLLSLNNNELKFSVVNLGIPGSSTRRQSQELAAFFKAHQAKIVILLTGRNNNLEIEQEVERRDPSVVKDIRYQLCNSRSFRFLKFIVERLFHRDQKDPAPARTFRYGENHDEYLNAYLTTIRALCREKGAKLIVISYYNSTDEVIRSFALRYRIPYFDLTSDFESLFTTEGKVRYISPDRSHMNRWGYKFFAEQLYRRLFLEQEYLGLRINPLLRRMKEADFYSDPADVKLMIKLQEERIEQSRNSDQYPYELIHLGHIYTEIGNDEAAKDFYEKALLVSGYNNNNTIVSPIIDWHLKRGEKGGALAICEEILRHNPQNSIATRYRSLLLSNPQLLDVK